MTDDPFKSHPIGRQRSRRCRRMCGGGGSEQQQEHAARSSIQKCSARSARRVHNITFFLGPLARKNLSLAPGHAADLPKNLSLGSDPVRS